MPSPIKLKIKAAEARVEDVRLRIPFKFGIATLTETPKMTMKVVAEDASGKSAVGYSSDMLPALWFDKDPGKTIDQKVDDQIAMAEFAMAEYLRQGAGLVEPFALWWGCYPVIKEEGRKRGINALTAGFGSSFLERAMIDASCRLAGVPFFDALKSGRFAMEPHLVHHELAGFKVESALPVKALDHIWCRHTVGLGDTLRKADRKPDERINDGLPETLEEDIDAYGLRYFKVKIDADRERNLARCKVMADVFAAKCPQGFKITLDGNEQVENIDDAAWLFDRLAEASPAGKKFVDSILFLEQPLHRAKALSPEIEPAIRAFSKRMPVIIDESDDDVTSLHVARDRGYSGISAKNCKGVFKAVMNKCLIAKWGADGAAAKGQTVPSILSSEDLTNTGVLALQEDFATLAALGIDHSERNGHHYFRGLAHLTNTEQECAIASHPDVYEQKSGFISLRIKEGKIALGSIQCPGYGYACDVDFERRPTIEAWRKTRKPSA